MILDHIVAQDVRGLENPDILRIPNLDLELRRDSAPAARRPCKDVVLILITTTTTTRTRTKGARTSTVRVSDVVPHQQVIKSASECRTCRDYESIRVRITVQYRETLSRKLQKIPMH